MHNAGNFIVSMGRVVAWLGQQAEALGVEIYPGFAGAEVLYHDDGSVKGVATGAMGVGRDGQPKANYEPGVELHATYTLFAEGCRGSLTKQLEQRFALRDGRGPQTYALGIKELWEVDPAQHRPGLVLHTIGWPLDQRTYGGSFLYHLDERQVAVGFVVGLDYRNPYLSPFEEFQRFKTHPAIAPTFADGERLSYGARALTEGGYQSVPKLVFPGGALVGCAAGFVNVPRIKGSHNAILSGMLAADHAADALGQGRANDELTGYEDAWRASAIGDDLRPVRNAKPLWSKLGTVGGIAVAGLDMWTNTLGFSLIGTLSHSGPDHASLLPATDAQPIDYPKPDGVLSFDRSSSVYLSNTAHDEDQPVHLHVEDTALQKSSEHDVFGGPSARYCPAGVYEWVEDAEGTPRYVINAANCVHCKTCDIKDPNRNIDWVPPEGGSGPNYRSM
jgi:electron-transferring-flavoprotein dehydrogenase